MNRRNFFRSLGRGVKGAAALGAVAAVGIPALPAAAKTTPYVATWRKLYGGIDTTKTMVLKDTHALIKLINETNEILADTPWAEGKRYD